MAPRARRPTIDELVADLRRVVRVGLPVRLPREAGPLLTLYTARIRATSAALPDLVSALDAQLRSVIQSFGDGPDGKAAQALFGLAPGTRGLNLTERRAEAARIRQRSPDHWRKHLEPALLRMIAQELYQREQFYQPRIAEVAPQRPPGEEPAPTSDNPAELERHEYDARVSAALYAYRAELVASYRLGLTEPDSAALDEALAAALFTYARLLLVLNRYLRKFGNEISFGGASLSAAGAIQIAGWHPPFTRQERDYLVLTLTTAGEDDNAAFQAALADSEQGQQLMAKWGTHLRVGDDQPPQAMRS
jgi:hypothetical protein